MEEPTPDIRLGIIGYPLGHTASPWMYNQLFKRLKLKAVYTPYEVPVRDLPSFVSKARSILVGFNVTIPHKTRIIEYIDELDPMARAVGAVNTVANEDGVLIGYNTDAYGFTRALLSMAGRRVFGKALIIGAGGAARAVLHGLAGIAEKAVIASKTGSTASKLASTLQGVIDAVGVVNDSTLLKKLGPYELIVNASPVGMKPDCRSLPIDPSLLDGVEVVFDLVYNPLKTLLLEHAEDAGALVIDGLWMLSYQGVENLRIWLGIDADPEELRSYALRYVAGDTGEC